MIYHSLFNTRFFDKINLLIKASKLFKNSFYLQFGANKRKSLQCVLQRIAIKQKCSCKVSERDSNPDYSV